MNEQTGISAQNKALATLQRDIAKLDSATSSRQIKSLTATISRLNRQLLRMAAQLSLLATQTYNTARGLSPQDPALVSSALSNLLTVQMLSAQVGLGLTPATPSQ
jgi:hypothetical protein